MPKSYAVPPPPHHNEGKTAAGWTMNIGIVLGAVVIAVGMVGGDMAGGTNLSFLLWVGAGLIALSIIVGIIMSRAGMGQPKEYGKPAVAPAAARTEAAHK